MKLIIRTDGLEDYPKQCPFSIGQVGRELIV
jgi:hypothetical protein